MRKKILFQIAGIIAAFMVALLLMLFLMTLMGRNFGLFPYPTAEQKNKVIRRICAFGSRHRKMRYFLFFVIIGFVFILNIYKHLFFSEAARKTYAKA